MRQAVSLHDSSNALEAALVCDWAIQKSSYGLGERNQRPRTRADARSPIASPAARINPPPPPPSFPPSKGKLDLCCAVSALLSALGP